MFKKSILTLVFLVCAIVSSAQIQRNILDFTLGTTTKTQVNNYLKNNHIEFSQDKTGMVEARDIKFAGHVWPVIQFSFYKNKLYIVKFLDNDGFTPAETLTLVCDNLKTGLFNKYSSCYKGKEDSMWMFGDGRTEVYLSYGFFLGARNLGLIYFDSVLYDKQLKEGLDEL